MDRVPKIVAQRLKAASSLVGEHPDADVLTAFSERSLTEKERTSVLEHLARCNECREIVALALPVTEEAVPVLSVPGRSWLAWPTMRWAFVAAGIVAIAAFGVSKFRRENTRMMASFKEEPIPQMSTRTDTKTLPTAPASPKEQDETQVSGGAAKEYMIATKPAAEPKARQSAGGPVVYKNLPHGPRVQNQLQYNAQQNANALNAADGLVANADKAQIKAAVPPPAPSQQAARPSPPNPVPAQTEMVMVDAAPAAPSRDLTASAAQNQPTLKASSDQETKMERAKPAQPPAAMQTVEVSGASPMIQTENAVVGVEGRNTTKLLSSARWTISQNGVLQRSFDQGNTWQDVNVAASTRNAASTLEIVANDNYAGSAQVARAKNKDLAKKQSSAPVFRAIAVNGDDVWAGGVAGALYHSTDAGDHWLKIMPNSAGAPLTGDIVALDFPDAQHGRITTSNSESWITSDAGQTWQKQ